MTSTRSSGWICVMDVYREEMDFSYSLSIALDKALPWFLSLPFMRDFVSATVNLETQITGWSIIASFLVAATVGLTFGIYPAIVASRQDPIVALRHD